MTERLSISGWARRPTITVSGLSPHASELKEATLDCHALVANDAPEARSEVKVKCGAAGVSKDPSHTPKACDEGPDDIARRILPS
mmetsp:Transcript_79670/g.193047  ORF Transcript_79670/g.193047 Transcript_79670/m.193047 type:complete len:85 (+) Transcript_79670:264-518(+)